MASLEIKIELQIIEKVGSAKALHDTSNIAIHAEKDGLKVERTGYREGVPTKIIVTDPSGKKTEEDIKNYIKTYIPWHNFI